MTVERQTENRKKNAIIKIFICLSAIFVMMPYATLFGLPFYIVGLFLLWYSKLSKRQKWKWSILPLISVGILYTIIGLIIYIFKL
jgi:hypothetical protein